MTDQNDTPESDTDSSQPAVAEGATPAPQPGRSRTPRALAITGIALASALGLGLVFAGGVAVGRVLPDQRGPDSVEVRGPGGDRGGQLHDGIEQRMDERGERREERSDERRELFEQWLDEQGIDLNAPAEPNQ